MWFKHFETDYQLVNKIDKKHAPEKFAIEIINFLQILNERCIWKINKKFFLIADMFTKKNLVMYFFIENIYLFINRFFVDIDYMSPTVKFVEI